MLDDNLDPNSGTRDKKDNADNTASSQSSPASIPATNPESETRNRKKPRFFVRIWRIHRKRQRKVSPLTWRKKSLYF
jgi:hypothetical protein